jgi:hypothetical protein
MQNTSSSPQTTSLEPTATETVILNNKEKDEYKPFCTQCTSKGVRHLKNCPTNTVG